MGTKVVHEYRPMTPEKRPQDPHGDGRGLLFETLEHGGEYPDTMPQAIRLETCDVSPISLWVPLHHTGAAAEHEAAGRLVSNRRGSAAR